MIPYEDLVSALQAWRVKQGLPVGSMAQITVSASPVSSSATSMPTSGPGSPSSTPILGSRAIADAPRTAPPSPPPMSARPGPPGPPPRSPTPPPLAPPDSIDEPVDEAALIEEAQYDEPGNDFAMSFGHDAPPAHHDGGEAEGTTLDGPEGIAGRSKPNRGDW